MKRENTPPERPTLANIDHWIAGRSVPNQTARSADVFDPTTGRVTGRVALASRAEADRAVTSALEAFRG